MCSRFICYRILEASGQRSEASVCSRFICMTEGLVVGNKVQVDE